jgi:protein TonB
MFLDTHFELEDRRFKNRKTAISAFSTIALHSLLFLFLVWQILTPPDPPYTDSAGGVSVNFGTEETGSGNVQQTTLTPIQADFSPPPSVAKQVQATKQEDIATQDLEDAPVIEKKKPVDTPKPKVEETETPKTAVPTKIENTAENTKKESIAMPEHKVDPNAMFQKGAYGNPNNSKGEGTGGKQGDQGKTSGDPNSKNYLGGEDGIGMGPGRGDFRGVTLKGRRSTSLPAPRFCNEKGNVIIDITVNRDGDVVDAKYHREGSTITDNCSIDNAKRAAKLSKFNSAPNADPLQYGSINYVFTVQ